MPHDDVSVLTQHERMDFTLESTTVIDAPPARVFDVVTDIDGLPTWNEEVGSIVESPDDLVVGAVWVVDIRALHTHWHSRSMVAEIDPVRGRFAYRSCSDDGNP